ncbi:unnamed protein product [Xyrichtys novacula]|uniref:Unnamed protein product n=1 Tax=Xyrichtys novacula TaxID=13765 RepID=A0AAV1H2W7_XYRNO|nr:unnamed protein product [Xyrichtys novacula]
MTVIPLFLLVSDSSDEELCAQCKKACEAAHRRTYTRQHHESRLFRSMITDVLYLDEVRAVCESMCVCVCVSVCAGCRPGSSVRVEKWGICVSGSLPVEEEEAPRRSGPLQKLNPHTDQTKARELQAGLSPDRLSRYLREYQGGEWALAACYHACRWRDTCL